MSFNNNNSNNNRNANGFGSNQFNANNGLNNRQLSGTTFAGTSNGFSTISATSRNQLESDDAHGAHEKGLIAGMVVLGIAVLLLIVIAIFWLLRCQRRRRRLAAPARKSPPLDRGVSAPSAGDEENPVERPAADASAAGVAGAASRASVDDALYDEPKPSRQFREGGLLKRLSTIIESVIASPSPIPFKPAGTAAVGVPRPPHGSAGSAGPSVAAPAPAARPASLSGTSRGSARKSAMTRSLSPQSRGPSSSLPRPAPQPRSLWQRFNHWRRGSPETDVEADGAWSAAWWPGGGAKSSPAGLGSRSSTIDLDDGDLPMVEPRPSPPRSQSPPSPPPPHVRRERTPSPTRARMTRFMRAANLMRGRTNSDSEPPSVHHAMSSASEDCSCRTVSQHRPSVSSGATPRSSSPGSSSSSSAGPSSSSSSSARASHSQHTPHRLRGGRAVVTAASSSTASVSASASAAHRHHRPTKPPQITITSASTSSQTSGSRYGASPVPDVASAVVSLPSPTASTTVITTKTVTMRTATTQTLRAASSTQTTAKAAAAATPTTPTAIAPPKSLETVTAIAAEDGSTTPQGAWMAIRSFSSSSSLELDFSAGDRIEVLEQYADGWGYGRRLLSPPTSLTVSGVSREDKSTHASPPARPKRADARPPSGRLSPIDADGESDGEGHAIKPIRPLAPESRRRSTKRPRGRATPTTSPCGCFPLRYVHWSIPYETPPALPPALPAGTGHRAYAVARVADAATAPSTPMTEPGTPMNTTSEAVMMTAVPVPASGPSPSKLPRMNQSRSNPQTAEPPSSSSSGSTSSESGLPTPNSPSSSSSASQTRPYSPEVVDPAPPRSATPTAPVDDVAAPDEEV
ncbi:hypothetical protein CXG81DRAFT_19996 [Caulochytrium protostelioides]|uniref:SH3 domain-containing protein n=1 Tax=Caulochytrium protostelioides TaxID=1555241 RepID=A0A4V1IUB7_9FUNG|nr:hypothetical protein CXG81DRAFT_19996 [Caulochytrium protostelioides]|eukprot:RKO99998.1 hypothetical protein CXG81DRAFT_19996 [Caulochytrium protostelioides]